MADLKISQLTAYTPPLDADVFPIVENASTETKKVTFANIKATLLTYFNTQYGAGTVTSASVVTANGVSGSVSNATTTPAITLTLGAITPTSVNGLTITTTTGTLTITNGKTLSVLKTMSFNAADDTGVYTLPTGTKTLVATDVTTLSSLVSVGTISTGVWNGTVVAGQYGGTGVANTGKTITVSGNTVIGSSTDTVTFATGGATSVTLPITGTLATLAGTETFTNKRITQRVVTTTDDATSVINVDTTDVYELSAVANNTEFTTSGTPTDGQKLIVRYKDAGVSKTLTWTFATAIGVTLPTATTAGKWGYVGCIYNSAASQWHAVAVTTQA